MSTLRTYNLQSIDSGSVNIQLSPNAGAILAGLTTAQSGLHITDGNVAIGTDTPGAKLEVRDGSSQGIIVRCDSTQATDTNKALRVRNNSDTNTFHVSHKGQGYFAGSVGIGTDNPLNSVDILNSTGRTRINEFGHIITRNHNHGTTNYWSIAPRNGGELDIGYGAADGNGVVTGDILTIDIDGNVSIGTDNPTGTNPARLTVLSDPSTAVSYGSSDAFAVKSKNIDGTGISTVFAIRPFSPSGPVSAAGLNPLYNVAINAWVHIDSSGQNCNFLADDAERTFVGFYTGTSVDHQRAGEYTTLNGDGTPTAFGLANITYRTTNGLSFSRGDGASANVSFRFKGKDTHGDDNIIVKFQGDSDSLQIRNQSQGDYIIYNSQQGNSVAVYDGTGGAEFRYNDDSAKTLECDSDGVVSPYIYNQTSSNTSNYVRLNGSYQLQRSTSSRRYKNNIGVYTGGLSRISTIVPRVWNDHKDGERVVGIVAEELHESGYTDAVSYSAWFGGSEVGIGDDPSPMVGNGSTPVTKTGEELDDGVEVVDGISDRAIICDLVLAVQELTSRISALESN